MEAEKNKSSINIYTNKNITELNELIYAGTKLVCEKIGIPFKRTKINKIRMGNLTGNEDLKKSYENRQKRWNSWKTLGQKRKSNSR